MTEADYLSGTRSAYDTVAADYVRLVGATAADVREPPQDRTLLARLVELVAGASPLASRTIADVGCGPGRITEYLDALGAEVVGVDLSSEMVRIARATHPGLRFEVGSITALPLIDGEVGGIVAWYSIIHTPPDQLPLAFAEFRRVLVPGGQLLLAFQVGLGEVVRRSEAYGRPVSLDSYRHSPDHVSRMLEQAGLVVHTRMVRDPSQSFETTQQAVLIADGRVSGTLSR